MDRSHQRHGAAPKTVFVYPLVDDVRRRLQHADDASAGRPMQNAALGRT